MCLRAKAHPDLGAGWEPWVVDGVELKWNVVGAVDEFGRFAGDGGFENLGRSECYCVAR